MNVRDDTKFLTLDEIEPLIDRWQKEKDDIDPHNVDSMDRPAKECSNGVGREAINLVPDLLRALRAEIMVSGSLLEELHVRSLSEESSARPAGGFLARVRHFLSFGG
jgi:hypothetical protein